MRTRLTTLFILLTVLCLAPNSAFAQDDPAEVVGIAFLSIELWPDYDDPQTLVLISAVLPLDGEYPATVRLPFPADATLNAVAYSDTQQQLYDITDYSIENGEIVITSPTPGVRIEYYVPYSVTGDQRSIEYTLQSPYLVGQLEFSIQEPRFADGFVLANTTEVVETTTGARFHLLASRTLNPGDIFLATAEYRLPNGQLTVSSAEAPPPGGSGIWANLQANWLLTLIGVAFLGIAAFFGWQSFRDRSRAKPRSGRAKPKVIICSNCGAQNRPRAKFCSTCGEPL